MNTDTLNRKIIHVVEFIGEKVVCENTWVFKSDTRFSLIKKKHCRNMNTNMVGWKQGRNKI